MDYSLLPQLGIAGAIFGALVFFIKWMTKLHDRVMTDSKEERVAWQNLIQSFSNRLENHTNLIKNLTEQSNEAHKYQRDEHKEILNNQRQIIDEQSEVRRNLENK